MLGKNGIGKLIMKTVMPLINSELDRLLSDVVPFKLMVNINDKDEVEFLLNNQEKDILYPITEGSGLEKTISSLALRCVMTKVSSLPKPNLIVFDEVFGKVANVNLEYIGDFYQKVSEMFPNIFIISHNPLIKDWGRNIITVNVFYVGLDISNCHTLYIHRYYFLIKNRYIILPFLNNGGIEF